ncbi:MAG TPA: hypothetical protein VMS99_03570 [Acidimicrobiia bacterium]|nr:hypothetical protein [Acidimicrobiia bacterium]
MGHLELASGFVQGGAKDHIDDFLDRLRIVPRQPSQSDIDGKCIRLLARRAPQIPAGDLEALYEQLLATVESAQESRHPGLSRDADAIQFLAAEVAGLSAQPDKGGGRANDAKKLTRTRLEGLLPAQPITDGLMLLTRELAGGSSMTAMEEKLTLAGR